MVKKILSVALCLVLSLTVFCGCNLFVHNIERDYQRVVVDIPETHYAYTYSENDKDNVGEKGIPYCDYNGTAYYLSCGNVYYKKTAEGIAVSQSVESYDLFKNKDGNVQVYAFAEEVLDEVEYKEVKDTLLSGDPSKVKYMDYDVTLPARQIYKTEFANYINNYLNQYVNSGLYNVEQAIDVILDSVIVNRGLMINEAWKFFINGQIPMTQAAFNIIEQSVYGSIDTELRTLQETILEEKGMDIPDYDDGTSDDSSENSSTTYPVPPEEEEQSDNYNEQPWSIADERNRWPGIIGDAKQKSLELESVRRYIIQLEETVDADFRMTEQQKQRAKADIENLRKIQNEKGIEFVYPELGGTYLIDYLYRKNILESYVTSSVESYMKDSLSNSVTVTDAEIQRRYEDNLRTQRDKYSEKIEDFDTDVNADTETTFYYVPDTNRFFYVKHILLQFSEEQTAYLNNLKQNPNYSKEMLLAERAGMVNEIKAYAHVNGEDDTSVAYTANQVFTEIKAAVGKYSSNPVLAMREFDKMIYKFNQDPGSFNKLNNGYPVRTDENAEDNWVKEFSSAARELNKGGKVGAIYPELIVTDYGVHIMMYVGKFPKTVMTLSDYTDLSRTQTFKDMIYDELFTTKAQEKYDTWQRNNVYNMVDNEEKVQIHREVFKDFYDL